MNFGIEAVLRLLAFEHGQKVPGREHGHAGAGAGGGWADVGEEHGIVEARQALGHTRLELVDVQARAGDTPCPQAATRSSSLPGGEGSQAGRRDQISLSAGISGRRCLECVPRLLTATRRLSNIQAAGGKGLSLAG